METGSSLMTAYPAAITPPGPEVRFWETVVSGRRAPPLGWQNCIARTGSVHCPSGASSAPNADASIQIARDSVLYHSLQLELGREFGVARPERGDFWASGSTGV